MVAKKSQIKYKGKCIRTGYDHYEMEIQVNSQLDLYNEINKAVKFLQYAKESKEKTVSDITEAKKENEGTIETPL